MPHHSRNCKCESCHYILTHFVRLGNTISEFLDRVVPGAAVPVPVQNFVLHSAPAGLSQKFEESGYLKDILLRTFQNMGKHLPDGGMQYLGVDKASTPGDRSIRPDIIAMIPSDSTLTGCFDSYDPRLVEWSRIALSVYIRPSAFWRKDRSKEDGECSSMTEYDIEDRRTLAKAAASMMASQSSLCSFILLVDKRMARIYRFDRACALVSPDFDYLEDPQSLFEFFWRLSNPHYCNTIFGADDNVKMASPIDIIYAEQSCLQSQKYRERWNKRKDCDNNRAIAVPSVSPDVEEGLFVTLRKRNLSCKTVPSSVYIHEAIRIGDRSRARFTVKEAWYTSDSNNEVELHRQIQDHADLQRTPVVGVPRLVYGGNIDQIARKKTFSTDLHQTTHYTDGPCKRAGCGPLVHYRLVFDAVGDPLHTFRTTRILVEAIRDAVVGHRIAHDANILHRNINWENVLIALGKPFKGFIYNFCSASHIDKASRNDSVEKLRKRRGTPPFYATELIDPNGNSVEHRHYHDLESFYWVLLMAVLRHTHHNHPFGMLAVDQVFESSGREKEYSLKIKWLTQSAKLSIRRNGPLTHLMEVMKEAVLVGVGQHPTKAKQPLSYEAVLGAFDEALAMEGWPKCDFALPFSRHSPWYGNITNVSTRKRSHIDIEDSCQGQPLKRRGE